MFNKLTNDEICQIKAQAGTCAAEKIDELLTAVDGIPSAMENQADSAATTIAALKEDFNALLSKLKTVGLMKQDEEE